MSNPFEIIVRIFSHHAETLGDDKLADSEVSMDSLLSGNNNVFIQKWSSLGAISRQTNSEIRKLSFLKEKRKLCLIWAQIKMILRY